MPAGIRLDIHMGGFRDSAEHPTKSRDRLRKIADRLAEEVKRVIMEETNVVAHEEEGTLTTSDMMNGHVQEGLGANWPPEDASPEPVLLGEGLKDYLEHVASGKVERTLMPTKAYDDGSFYIHFNLDLR